MAFDTIEKRRYDGDPIELYDFVSGNGADDWHFTSADEEIVYDGETYTPINLRRSSFRIEPDLRAGEVALIVSQDNEIAQLFKDFPPSDIIDFTIRKRHRQDGAGTDIKFWNGKVSRVVFTSIHAIIYGRGYLGDLNRIIPRFKHQLMCQHALGDDRCGIDLDNDTDPADGDYEDGLAFTQVIILDSFNGGDETLLTSENIDYLDFNDVYGTFWIGGYALDDQGGSPTLERRLIINQDRFIGGGKGQIEIIKPFSTLAPSDDFTIVAGCDRTRLMCIDKFANLVNYGGNPFIPFRNPFKGDIP